MSVQPDNRVPVTGDGQCEKVVSPAFGDVSLMPASRNKAAARR